MNAKYLQRLDVVRRVELVAEPMPAEYNQACETATQAAVILRPFIGGKTREHFAVVVLDARRVPLGVMIVSIGTLSASLVHPREVYQAAILANAAAVIVGHNHPSGILTPSPEDRETTRRLSRAGELLGIPLLDHVILGEGATYYSFKEGGML